MNPVKFSVFDNCLATKSRQAGMDKIVATVKGLDLEMQTLEVRRAAEKSDARKMKQLKSSAFPAMMPACQCRGGSRLDEEVECLTGICQADFDHLEPDRLREARERLRADPHVFFLYTSMSGRGLHVLYRWEAPETNGNAPAAAGAVWEKELYEQAFRQGNEYLACVACADYDPGVESVVHLSCLCHDAEAYYNPGARPFRVDTERNVRKRGKRNPLTRSPLVSATTTAAGLWDGEWTEGEACDYARELRDRHDLYQKGNRHNYLVGLAFLLSAFGVSEQGAAAYLQRTFPDYRDEPLDRLAGDCYRRSTASHGCLKLPRRATLAQSPRKAGGGKPRPQRKTRTEQIAEFLGTHRLRYDVLSQKTQQWTPKHGWTDLTDRMTNDLFLQCCQHLGRNVQSGLFRDVLCSSVVPTVHPLRDYVLSLPAWDEGQPDYIREVLDMVTVVPEQRELWHWAARKWFVAMVAGWMQEESVNHEVLVLVGEQGIFKTSWIERLMPPELRGYCSKQSTVRFLDKDEQLRATEFGLVNLDEIDQMTEQDLNALKSLVSATDVNVRAVYGRNKERRLRVASYAASGNKREFLSDQTGNRRWLPFHVLSILSPRLHPMPYAGMYAQAWHLVQEGFKHWFDAEDIERMHPQTRQFAVETPEEQLLPVYFQPCEAGTPGAVVLTAAEIQAKLVVYGNIRRPMSLSRLGHLLRNMGFQQVRSKKRRGYILLEKSADAINAERHLGAR